METRRMAEKEALLKLQKRVRKLIAEIEEVNEGGVDEAMGGDELSPEEGGELGDVMDGMGDGLDLGGEDAGDELATGGAADGDDLASARQAYFKSKAPPPRRAGTATAVMAATEPRPPKAPFPPKGKKGAA